ncbi:expressed unknown protein [Seminavis robusta]|uniref:Large ribosomal subunit protein mL59 domain-containing protein n=1 Tax=Seminavis robusta TaxID=568900 RepID=A0A9N8E4Z4_9STRA|nr:expressed unknown protein [Seminavis robusta]|eukprot:Sro555_g165660.1 n/a (154) ;mRNA; r:15670-16131
MASSVTTKLPAAVRKLCQHGVEALKPQLIKNSNTRLSQHWNPPAIPKRSQSMLRKRAVREGTYGSFDATTGKGWDPAWDIELAKTGNGGGNGRIRLRPNKKTSRDRTREQRAQKIEKTMEDMDEQIAQYYMDRKAEKPVKDFEWYFKKHTRRK